MLRSIEGATTVELAFVLPVFFLLMFGIIELGRMMYVNALLEYSVEAATRCGAVDSANCGTNTAIVNYAVTKSAPYNFPSSVFTVSAQSCGTQVSASYTVSSLVPSLLPYNISLASRACYPKLII